MRGSSVHAVPDSDADTISMATGGATLPEINSGVAAPLSDGYFCAIECVDLSFVSGLMTIEDRRLIAEASIDDRQSPSLTCPKPVVAEWEMVASWSVASAV